MKSNTKTPGEVVTQRVNALNKVIQLLLKSIDHTEERDTEHDKVAFNLTNSFIDISYSSSVGTLHT